MADFDSILRSTFDDMVRLGGATSSFPGLRNIGAVLEARLADDSDFSVFRCDYPIGNDDAATKEYVDDSISVEVPGGIDRQVQFNDSGAFGGSADLSLSAGGLLQLGGVTSSYPAIKRSAATLNFRLADDSAFCDITGNTLNAQSHVQSGSAVGQVRAGSSGYFYWTSGSKMYGGLANGNIALFDNAASDFGLLQLGGTSSSFPAIKRSTVNLQAKLADDSAFTDIDALDFNLSGGGSLGTHVGDSTIHFTVGSINHGLLDGTSLTHDDHPGYLWGLGRAGGQTLIGGTLTTQALTLQDNVVDANQVTWGNGLFDIGIINKLRSGHIAVNRASGATDTHNIIIEED